MRGRHQFRRRFSLQPPSPSRADEGAASTTADHSLRRSHSPRSQKIYRLVYIRNIYYKCRSFLRHIDSSAALPPTDEDTPTTGSGVASGNGDAHHRIVVMGAAKVGKTSIIHQFLYASFPVKYRRTNVEEMHHGEFSVGGTNGVTRLQLDILDTSGRYHEFPAMRTLSITSADAFILVYDVTDGGSFEEARTIREHIHVARGTAHVPIVVVGNKSDLEAERTMDTPTTESIVTVDWENGFVEASAKENTNIGRIFKELLAQAKLHYNLSPALRRKRRQSLPPAVAAQSQTPSPLTLPTIQQVQHLREKHANKRNSCSIS